jgi:uncharacterized protein
VWLAPSASLVLLSIPLSLVNALAEELLWRGVYASAYPGNLWLGHLYPAVGFAVSHFSPLSAISSSMPGGSVSFVVGALVWGIAWSWVAWRSRSVRWTIVSHFLLDYAGLGARIYLG